MPSNCVSYTKLNILLYLLIVLQTQNVNVIVTVFSIAFVMVFAFPTNRLTANRANIYLFKVIDNVEVVLVSLFSTSNTFHTFFIVSFVDFKHVFVSC